MDKLEEDGKKKYLEREGEFLYTGRRYQIPQVTAVISQDEVLVTILFCQGKDVYKIKITDDGVEAVKKDGKTEEIPAVPDKDIQVLEGVFSTSGGRELMINLQNETGKRFLYHMFHALQIGPVTSRLFLFQCRMQ